MAESSQRSRLFDAAQLGGVLDDMVRQVAGLPGCDLPLAVLADRCLARQPLRADVVGLRLQVAAGDIVECRVPPYEPDFGIVVVHRASGEGVEGGTT